MFTFNIFNPPPNVPMSAIAVVGEVKLYAGPVAPNGWFVCDGSTKTIAGNEALFAAISNAYGGDGITTFALPDLRDRVPIGASAEKEVGTSGGAAEVTLAEENLPAHSHTMSAGTTSNGAISPSTGAYLTATSGGTPSAAAIYASSAINPVQLAGGSSVGEGEPVNVQNPYVAMHYIIYAGV